MIVRSYPTMQPRVCATSSPRSIVARVLALALALVPVAAPIGDARSCPAYELSAAPMGGQTEIATDGGVLIVQVQERRGGPRTLGFTVDGAGVEPDDQYLAPGLERWRVPEKAGATLVMTDAGLGGAASASTSMAVVAPRGRLKAPAIRAATSDIARPRMRLDGPGAPYTLLAIELARPLPDDAVALVVYGAVRGADGIAWAPVEPGQRTFAITGGGKGCGGGPGPIYAGDRVSVAWIDARGRLSPRTPARAVRRTPAPPAPPAPP